MILTVFLINAPIGRGEEPEWKVKINIPATTMFVYKDDLLWKKFNVAVGKIDKQTPIGKFRIVRKIKDPTWYPEGKPPVPPGPDNPLGAYWLGLSIPSYGIHGNNNPFSIGYWVSSGCIRVKNEEVELLFKLLPLGTPVEIVYEPVNLEIKNGRIWLDLYPDFYHLIPDMRKHVYETVKKQYPDFNIHDDGLWYVIGEHRPVLLEIPEAVDLLVDEKLQNYEAFRWREKIFLPETVNELWDRRGGQREQDAGGAGAQPKFMELWEFLMDNSGKAFGIWDEQSNSVRITTIRLYFQGKTLPVRGWFREEPYLVWEELVSILGEMNFIAKGAPAENLSQVNQEELIFHQGTAWISLSKIRQVCPGLGLRWSDEEWRIYMDLKK